MRFSSETKRTLHPQVGLIPHFLWESHDGFNHELPDNILALMQAESADIINQIQRHKIRPYENRGRRCAWLAVALSHPDLNAEYLHQIGCELGMSDNGLFNASAYYGHLEVLRYLEEKSPARFQEIMAAEV